MYNIGQSSQLNDAQLALAWNTMGQLTPYLGGARNTISRYADSPMLTYAQDNWNQSMQAYTNPLDRQLSYKLKDIAVNKGNEFHSFGRKVAQANAQAGATSSITNYANDRMNMNRQMQAQDWQSALGMQQQARGMDINSLLGFISTPTQQNSIQAPNNIGGIISNIGSMVGGVGASLGSMAGNAAGSQAKTS